MNTVTLESALEKEGFLLRPVVGMSMLPMLDQKKDVVRIVPAVQPLKKYDVPLYKRPNGQYVLHRILEVKKGYYVICGDNLWKKEKVPFEWVFGVLEGFYKDGTYVPCTDEEYQKYIRRRTRGRWVRMIKAAARKLLGKKK